MSKAALTRRIHDAVEFHLLGPGSWPADPEAVAGFWKLLDDLGLLEQVPGEPGLTRCTRLGLELNVELMSIFAGAIDVWDIPLLLHLMGYLEDDEADAMYATTSKHPEKVIRRHVLQVYFRFFNRSRYLN